MREMFEKLADRISQLAGRPLTFLVCCAIILIWAAVGPSAHYSDTWQLIVNTGTTIITFLMVFLIQSTQNRDNKALHAKLDELLRTRPEADVDLIAVERESERVMDARKARILERANVVRDAP